MTVGEASVQYKKQKQKKKNNKALLLSSSHFVFIRKIIVI